MLLAEQINEWMNENECCNIVKLAIYSCFQHVRCTFRRGSHAWEVGEARLAIARHEHLGLVFTPPQLCAAAYRYAINSIGRPIKSPSLSSFPFSFVLSLPSLPLKHVPLNPAKGLGQRCKFLQRGLGRATCSWNRIRWILALKSDIWWQQF